MKIFSVIVLFVLTILGVVIVIAVYSINQGLITVERGFAVSKDFVEGLKFNSLQHQHLQ